MLNLRREEKNYSVHKGSGNEKIFECLLKMFFYPNF